MVDVVIRATLKQCDGSVTTGPIARPNPRGKPGAASVTSVVIASVACVAAVAGCARPGGSQLHYAEVLDAPAVPADVAVKLQHPSDDCLRQARHFVRRDSDILREPINPALRDGYANVLRGLHPTAKQVLRSTHGVWLARDIPGAAARFIPCEGETGKSSGLVLLDVDAYPLEQDVRDEEVPGLYWRLLGIQSATAQAAGPQSAESQAADSQAAGPQSATAQSAESQPATAQSAESQAAGPQAAGPQAAGPHATTAERPAAASMTSEVEGAAGERARLRDVSRVPSAPWNGVDAPASDKNPGVRYVLLHELGHALSLLSGEFVLDTSRSFRPGTSAGFMSFSWREHTSLGTTSGGYVPMSLGFDDWRVVRRALDAEPTALAPGYRRTRLRDPTTWSRCGMAAKLPAAGFVTPAAAVSPTEDYAELFAHAILASEGKVRPSDHLEMDGSGCNFVGSPYFSRGVSAKRHYIERAIRLQPRE